MSTKLLLLILTVSAVPVAGGSTQPGAKSITISLFDIRSSTHPLPRVVGNNNAPVKTLVETTGEQRNRRYSYVRYLTLFESSATAHQR